MDGCHAKGCWLLVLVMHLMEVLVEEGKMVGPVMPVRDVVLGRGRGKEKERVSVRVSETEGEGERNGNSII